ncbi:MAG: tetratricopeptide repeat protein [Kiritimatiellia bacterium]
MAARNEEMLGETAFPERARRARGAVAAAGLAALVFFAFGGALECGFVRFDDDVYVTENPQVAQGLTIAAVRWALTTGHASNWHPLAWLSHMADVELYGLNPAGHHLTNLLLHAANAILLFWALRRMTRRAGLSWMAAALWAVHPLRVESVVWISERKDVLAMLFGLLAVGMHGRNAPGGGTRPTTFRIGPVAVFFALSLMAKPTWVTLPFLLLLLDVWPLGRWPAEPWRKLAAEKWPLFALAAGSCAATVWAQGKGGAVGALDVLPLATRIVHAGVAYSEYVRMLVWPTGLAAFYPHPIGGHSLLRMAVSLALVAVLTAGAAGQFRRRPWLTVGWFWFLGALVPMIGLVQVGSQAWADRYTYLPHIGLIVAAVWGAGKIRDRQVGTPCQGVRQSRSTDASERRPYLLASATVLAIALAVVSRGQTAVWRTTETLFQQVISVVERNALAHGNLGMWYMEQGRWPEAEIHLQRSLEIQPKRNKARVNLANALVAAGRKKEAVRHYQAAVAEDLLSARALNNLAWLLATDPEATPEVGARATEHAERAVAWTHGKFAPMLDTLGVARAAAGDFAGAVEAGEQALALTTDPVEAKAIRKRLDLYRSGTPYRE